MRNLRTEEKRNPVITYCSGGRALQPAAPWSSERASFLSLSIALSKGKNDDLGQDVRRERSHPPRKKRDLLFRRERKRGALSTRKRGNLTKSVLRAGMSGIPVARRSVSLSYFLTRDMNLKARVLCRKRKDKQQLI